MRLCAHVRLDRGFGKPLKERDFGNILTPDGMLRLIAYTYKRKHQCSILLHVKSAKISIKGQYRNAFLAYSFRSRKQVQKYEEYFIRQKKYSHMSGKRCIFAAPLGQTLRG